MPKPGGHANGSRFDSLQDYYEHDDRKNSKKGVRRVSFKNTNNHYKELKGRLADMIVRSKIEEDDNMGESRFDERAGSRRRGSPIPKGQFGNLRRLMVNRFGWYQITVNNGQHYTKDDVIRAILGCISPDIFIPHYWRIEKHCVIFFVDDFNIAHRLQKFENGIQMSDGQRIFLRIRNNCPNVPVDDAFKEKMKYAMADRYNPHTKVLDLSSFHADPKLKDTFVGLFRANVMSAAIQIIQQNIPDVVGITLNDNRLYSLEGFKNIPQRLPSLQIIHLANNKLPSLAHVLALRNVPIVELSLEGNPLRNRYKDKSQYISEVRRKFPKVQKLDGELLEPEIKFEVNDPSTLPEAKASYLCDPKAAGIIREFLETYFKIFDSDNRSPLMAAYHSEAMMSITVPPASQAGRIAKFWNYSRNLRRLELHNVSGEHIKYRLLKTGNLPIVAILTELPKTQHDLQSFSVDLTLYVEGKMMIFTVGGLFKEFDSSSSNTGEVRYFRRDFVVVPNGPGSFCIRNEMFYVTSATHSQIRSFNRNASAVNNQGPSTSSSALAAAAAANSSNNIQNRLQMQQSNQPIVHIPQSMMPQTIVAQPTQPDDNTKMQMVQALSAHSGMNLDWSKKCLEETNWDYNRAVFAFDQLHKENKIPADAFIK